MPSAHGARRNVARRVIGVVAVTVCLLVGGDIAIAANDTKLDRPARATRFESARRGGSVQVAEPPAQPKVDEPPKLSRAERFTREAIRLTNIERVAAGVAPVVFEPRLTQAADVHARDIASKSCKVGVLSHTGSDGSNAGDRIQRTGLQVAFWGENIACAHQSPETVVRGWMRSDGHRANLLNPRHTHIGFDVEEDADGTLYWVQLFADVD